MATQTKTPETQSPGSLAESVNILKTFEREAVEGAGVTLVQSLDC